MTDKITFQVDDRALRRKINSLEKAAGNVDGVLNTIGRKLKTKIDLGFNASQSPWGRSWAPLKYRNGQPLQDTRRLRRSIIYRLGSEGKNHFVDVGTNLKTSEGVRYPAVHQFGATISIAARSQQIYRSLSKSGGFNRGGKFVRKSKSNFASNVTLPAYQIVIPARPFLPLDADGDVDLPRTWQEDVVGALRSHVDRALFR